MAHYLHIQSKLLIAYQSALKSGMDAQILVKYNYIQTIWPKLKLQYYPLIVRLGITSQVWNT